MPLTYRSDSSEFIDEDLKFKIHRWGTKGLHYSLVAMTVNT
jgi:hypothetical protein